MRFIWISVRKDWIRVRRDPFSLLTSLAIPLILAVMMSLVFGRGQAVPQGRLLVADEDSTLASNLLLGGFNREPLNKMLVLENVSQADGRARINRGDGSALLIIPTGFQAALVGNHPFQLQLFTNPSQRILPQIVEQSLSIMVDGAFYAQQLAGPQFRALDKVQAPPDSLIASVSVAFNHLAQSLQRYLNPPVMALETAAAADPDASPRQSFAATFLPSMIFMGLLLIASSMAQDIWRERLMGTLRRLAVSPAPLSGFLAGRLVFVAMVFALMAMAGLVASHTLAAVPVANLPAAVLWLTFAGTALFLMMLVVTLTASTARAASVMGNLIVFPLAMLGGCFFPFAWMPAWMARIGRLTPNGWAITQFQAILSGEIDARRLAVAVAVLTAVGAVMFVLAMRRLRLRFLV
jgi:ABC-type multidrug transport system permease subunit